MTQKSDFRHINRRKALSLCTTAAALAVVPGFAHAGLADRRALTLHNLHTGEKLSTVYWADGAYLPAPLSAIATLCRDFRTGDVKPIDAKLLDLLHALRGKLGTDAPFHVISGYRSPATNAMLSSNSGGVAKKSLHMRGMAIDIRLPGRELSDLRRAARSLQRGGVGYYPRSDFVHVDTGRVRFW